MTVVVWSDQIVGPSPLNCECPSVGELNNGVLLASDQLYPAAPSRILAPINTLTMLVVEISL